MRPKRLMKPRIVRPEVACKPRVQALSQLDAVDVLGVFVRMHDLAKVIEQALVIALVRIERIVASIPHEFFLEREMRGDPLEQVTEEGGYRQLCSRGIELVVKSIDEIDQFSVLMIDGFDTDAVFVLPGQ
jgi:hypothetical protein